MNPEELEQFFDAVEGGDVEAVARRLDAEPQLMEAQHPSKDATPLTWAACMGRLGVVRLLLERGAEVNASTASSGFTALHEAALNGHEEIVAVLLSSGADSSRKTWWRSTALVLVSIRGRLGVARQLLQHMRGRGLDERDIDGWTALWAACFRGHVGVARALLLAGADHTIAAKGGLTPRQAAEESGRTECMALLEVSG
jgi:ankyrin repeat protein